MASNVYVIKGDDEILIGEELRRVLDSLPSEADGSRWVEETNEDDYLAGEEPTLAPVVSAALTPPMFSQHRVVVARHLARFTTAPSVLPLVEYLADPLPSTILVLVWEKGPKYSGRGTLPKSLSQALKSTGAQIVDSALPTAAKGRQGWLNDQLATHNIKLDSAAKALLFEHLGEDLNRLGATLNTLEGSYGPGAAIGVDELRPFVGAAGGVPPWELTDAISNGDIAAAISTLGRMMGAGERHALQIMATLHRHIGGLMALDGASVRSRDDAAKLLGMAPYPAEKLMKLARSTGSERARQQLLLLAEADLDLRGASEWPDELILEVLVARLARLSARR